MCYLSACILLYYKVTIHYSACRYSSIVPLRRSRSPGEGGDARALRRAVVVVTTAAMVEGSLRVGPLQVSPLPLHRSVARVPRPGAASQVCAHRHRPG